MLSCNQPTNGSPPLCPTHIPRKPMLQIDTRPQRIVVIESQALFAKAICHLLSTDDEIEILGDYRNITLAPLTNLRPNLLLVDMEAHAYDLAESIARCRE